MKHNSEAYRQWMLKPHNAMECHKTGISCGVRELSNINAMNAQSFAKWVNGTHHSQGDDEWPLKGYSYIFSDNRKGVGKEMAVWIKKFKLGSVVHTPWRINPNSDAQIRVWIWKYNGNKVDLSATST